MLGLFCGWNAGSKISSPFHRAAFTFDVRGQGWSRRRWTRWGTRWRISRRSLQVGEVHFDKKFLLRVKAGETAVTFCRENVVYELWKKWKICVANLPHSLSSPVESQKVLFLGGLFRWGRSGGRGSSSGRPAPPPRPFGPTKPNLVSSVGEAFKTFHHRHFSAKLGWFKGQSSIHFTKQTQSRLH